MSSFATGNDWSGKVVSDTNLRGARFVECDLSDVVIRGSDISGMEIDAPWLRFGKPLIVNGLDVGPLVEADLNRRFPGRELQEAADPEGLREAWAALERAWVALTERAGSMPAGTVDRSVAGEWSFAQTLEERPYCTPLAKRSASASSAKRCTVMTGPKISCCTASSSWRSPETTVGSKK